MHTVIPLESLWRLTDSLIAWCVRYNDRAYRASRVALLADVLSHQSLRQDLIHVRLVVDGTIPIGNGFDAWLIDQWCLIPTQAQVHHSHGLMVLVCQEGLEDLPMPDREVYEIGGSLIDHHLGAQVWIIKEVAPFSGDIVAFQCFVPDSPTLFRGRLQQRNLRWQTRSSIRAHAQMKRDALLAQLALIALRQNVADETILPWLVAYASKGAPKWAAESMPAAVDHAVVHYVVPTGSLRQYIGRVARGMAQEGQPPVEIRKLASDLEASTRTVYRWKSSHADEPSLRFRAMNLSEKRQKSQLAQVLAGKLGITVNAARGRIRRRMNKGLGIDDVARDLLRVDICNQETR